MVPVVVLVVVLMLVLVAITFGFEVGIAQQLVSSLFNLIIDVDVIDRPPRDRSRR